MRMSIVGLSAAGKSTFFDILTAHGQAGATSGKKGARIGTAAVPDARLQRLSEVYEPKKTTPATFEFIDTAAMRTGAGGQGLVGETLNEAKSADALALVIRDFDSDTVPHPEGEVDGMRDLQFILDEFAMADFIMLENRAERLRKQVQNTKQAEDERELAALDQVLAGLSEGTPARALGLTEQQRRLLAPYQLLTLKPMLVVVNLGDDAVDAMDGVIARYAERFPDHNITAMCAALEAELAQMEADEAADFMADLGIAESAFDRILAACFRLLGLKVFFTVGQDECRAWPVTADATAYDCAGAIHSDLQRGFIRAVVMPYAAFEAEPSSRTFKQKQQQHKKDYPVQDGDIMEIRFNV